MVYIKENYGNQITRLNEIKRYICSIIINQCVKKNNGPGLSVTSIKKRDLEFNSPDDVWCFSAT